MTASTTDPLGDTAAAATNYRRRRAAAVCLMLAPVAMLVEMASWPVGSDGDTAAELASAAAHPTAFTMAWIAESTGAALGLIGMLAVLGYLRNRGKVLAMIGAILVVGGQVGILTGGGFNAAIVPLAQQPERDVAIRTLDTFNAQPVLTVFGTMIWLGILGTVIVFVAAVRGGLVRWWILIPLVAALVTVPVFDNDLYGLAAVATGLPLAVAEIWLGVALFRTRRAASPTVSAKQALAGASVELEPASA